MHITFRCYLLFCTTPALNSKSSSHHHHHHYTLDWTFCHKFSKYMNILLTLWFSYRNIYSRNYNKNHQQQQQQQQIFKLFCCHLNWLQHQFCARSIQYIIKTITRLYRNYAWWRDAMKREMKRPHTSNLYFIFYFFKSSSSTSSSSSLSSSSLQHLEIFSL